MINDDSLRALESAQWTERFIKPQYESYCFARLPDLVRRVFAGDRDAAVCQRLLGPSTIPGSLADHDYDTVVLFFVDAFGWRFVEQYQDRYPFLRRIVREGIVSKLTAQFPSTTAAHVTTIHSGLPVGQHGVYEWFYYEPLVDRIISPLFFSFAGDHQRNTLATAGLPPEAFFPRHTLYQDLQALGVRSVVFQHQDYTPSPYSDTVCRGARSLPYRTLPEALVMLTELLLAGQGQGPAYYFLYFDDLDSACHRHGPDSPQAEAEFDAFLTAMEHTFHQALDGKLTRTLFLMTADHGQTSIDPATTIYLNQQLPRLPSYIRTNRAGQLLAPVGSPRDMFLHIKEDVLDEAQAYLQDALAGRCDVYRVADLIAQGLFGPEPPSATFLGRVGNLALLPYEHQSVWWYEADRFDQHYHGHHGGLSRHELETVLLAQPYV